MWRSGVQPFCHAWLVCLSERHHGDSRPVLLVEQLLLDNQVRRRCVHPFTTRTPAVTDVFECGRNVGALRHGRRVGFQ